MKIVLSSYNHSISEKKKHQDLIFNLKGRRKVIRMFAESTIEIFL